jgi:uncharacterized membrane protein YraQ (UPF0718 family)
MKSPKMTIASIVLLILTLIYSLDYALNAVTHASFQFIEMLKIVPPIFLLIGLIDVWVPRETMIKLMGEKSGIIGVLIAFMFGSLAAGPLLAAFPVAILMLKKGARYANVLFFLTIWASAKLPIVFYQVTKMGLKFTILVNITLIIVYLIGSYFIEKSFTKKELNNIYERALAH